MDEQARQYRAFCGQQLCAEGSLGWVAQSLKRLADEAQSRDNAGLDARNALIFAADTGHQVDVDLSGSLQDVCQRYPTGGHEARPGKLQRGRPRLGVVGREVTLLPRHWQWLDQQRGGASAALRRLVDNARHAHAGDDRVRAAQDSANRFMMAMASNLPGCEEAMRALYGKERVRFEQETADWPRDIRDCARRYAEGAWPV